MTAATAATLDRLRGSADAVLEHIDPDTDVVVGVANGEPHTVVDAIEAGAARFDSVRLHQMIPMRDRAYIDGDVPGLRHVSWFLSPHSRGAFHRGHCDLVPNSFSDVPRLMRRAIKPSLVITSASPPDRHGYFSLGANAEYTAALIGEVPFFVEVNAQVPRTFGANQLHVSDVIGFCEADYAPAELPGHEIADRDRAIAELVAERIPDGTTLQAGIGAVPDCVLGLLGEHRELGVHTELLGDGMIDLVEGGVITGTRKATHRNKIVTTTALGSARLYDFVADNPGVEFWPVEYTNDPVNIAREPHFVAIPPSRSTSWASAPPKAWVATTGPRLVASRTSLVARSCPSMARRSSSCTPLPQTTPFRGSFRSCTPARQ